MHNEMCTNHIKRLSTIIIQKISQFNNPSPIKRPSAYFSAVYFSQTDCELSRLGLRVKHTSVSFLLLTIAHLVLVSGERQHYQQKGYTYEACSKCKYSDIWAHKSCQQHLKTPTSIRTRDKRPAIFCDRLRFARTFTFTFTFNAPTTSHKPAFYQGFKSSFEHVTLRSYLQNASTWL